jgi:response regulator RpfG family c-di-GMP phosphodiesterase
MKNTDAKILIVDDEKNILKSLQRMLRNEPYIVKTAASPSKAIEMCKEENFHVIIGDYRMPEMDGTEMFLEINKINPDSIKIVLSGYSDINIITDALNKEYINKYILKPWNDTNLKKEIEKSLYHFNLLKTNKELHQKIIEQNENLKKINENLELEVQKRTKKLKLQNNALLVSQNVLNSIPVPIIGVDHENMIVLTNEMAAKIFPYASPGEQLKTDKIKKENLKAVNDDKTISLYIPELSEEFPNIIISPLKKRKNSNGTVIVFLPEKMKGE